MNKIERFHINQLSNFVNNFNVINFAVNEVPEIMKLLGVSTWAIGGSVAGMLYGIDFGRCPHDVDIIVPKGMMENIKYKVMRSPFFIPRDDASSVDEEWNTKHFAFKAAKGEIIDIIESSNFYAEGSMYSPYYAINNEVAHINIMSIKHLYFAKKRYHRAKDAEDLAKLEVLYNKCLEMRQEEKTSEEARPEISEKTLGELDTLQALKDALQGK